MNGNLFTQLHGVMLPNESIHFTLYHHPDGTLLLLQPALTMSDDDLPNEIKQARAALAIPMRVIGSPAELDAHFAEKLAGWAEPRKELYDSLEVQRESVREAVKEVSVQSGQHRASAAKAKPGSVSPATPAPAPSSPIGDRPANANAASEASACDKESGSMQPQSLF